MINLHCQKHFQHRVPKKADFLHFPKYCEKLIFYTFPKLSFPP